MPPKRPSSPGATSSTRTATARFRSMTAAFVDPGLDPRPQRRDRQNQRPAHRSRGRGRLRRAGEGLRRIPARGTRDPRRRSALQRSGIAALARCRSLPPHRARSGAGNGRIGAFLLFERHELGRPVSRNNAFLEEGDAYLKIKSARGSQVSVYYGTDGEQWAEARPMRVEWPARLNVGLGAVNSAFSPLLGPVRKRSRSASLRPKPQSDEFLIVSSREDHDRPKTGIILWYRLQTRVE